MGYDLAVYDRDGRLRVVVEAKRRSGTDSEWARQLRRNILAHHRWPAAALFALVVVDRVYVWRPETPAEAGPDYEIDTREILAPYFERIGAEPRTISPEAFELLIGWWLGELSRLSSATMDRQIVQSGLAEALENGRVVHQDAA